MKEILDGKIWAKCWAVERRKKHISLGLPFHEPAGDVHEIYRAMETAYKDGKLRAIGISNFLEERYFHKSHAFRDC